MSSIEERNAEKRYLLDRLGHRYEPSNLPTAVRCEDCGALVDTRSARKHDIFHDGDDGAEETS